MAKPHPLIKSVSSSQHQTTEVAPAKPVRPRPFCTGCQKFADQIEEYIEIAAIEEMTPDDYVRSEEGTYNRETGHFLCTDCYVSAGMPSSPRGWVAP